MAVLALCCPSLPCPGGLGWHLLPCAAPMGCGLLTGPLAVPKSPWRGAARCYPGVHAGCSEPTVEVLCSVYRFLSPYARSVMGLFS